jgi:hypothetical protein
LAPPVNDDDNDDDDEHHENTQTSMVFSHMSYFFVTIEMNNFLHFFLKKADDTGNKVKKDVSTGKQERVMPQEADFRQVLQVFHFCLFAYMEIFQKLFSTQCNLAYSTSTWSTSFDFIGIYLFITFM